MTPEPRKLVQPRLRRAQGARAEWADIVEHGCTRSPPTGGRRPALTAAWLVVVAVARQCCCDAHVAIPLAAKFPQRGCASLRDWWKGNFGWYGDAQAPTARSKVFVPYPAHVPARSVAHRVYWPTLPLRRRPALTQRAGCTHAPTPESRRSALTRCVPCVYGCTHAPVRRATVSIDPYSSTGVYSRVDQTAGGQH